MKIKSATKMILILSVMFLFALASAETTFAEHQEDEETAQTESCWDARENHLIHGHECEMQHRAHKHAEEDSHARHGHQFSEDHEEKIGMHHPKINEINDAENRGR